MLTLQGQISHARGTLPSVFPWPRGFGINETTCVALHSRRPRTPADCAQIQLDLQVRLRHPARPVPERCAVRRHDDVPGHRRPHAEGQAPLTSPARAAPRTVPTSTLATATRLFASPRTPSADIVGNVFCITHTLQHILVAYCRIGEGLLLWRQYVFIVELPTYMLIHVFVFSLR